MDDREDYLPDDEEEINEGYEVPAPDEEPNMHAIDLSKAATNGLTFSGEDGFMTAIFNIKEIAHDDFFQNGDREKVHNMGVINEYAKFLALINEAVGYVFSTKTPINNMFAGEVGDKMKEGLKHFFDIVLAQSQLPLNNEQSNYRKQLIEAQLIGFPYCHRKDCLTMD